MVGRLYPPSSRRFSHPPMPPTYMHLPPQHTAIATKQPTASILDSLTIHGGLTLVHETGLRIDHSGYSSLDSKCSVGHRSCTRPCIAPWPERRLEFPLIGPHVQRSAYSGLASKHGQAAPARFAPCQPARLPRQRGLLGSRLILGLGRRRDLSF